ncbi:MAG: hypothetical protein K2L13_03015 [Opitutales bacterium]|nr:hypothetical protein [Opitutales bacterium]
MSEVNYSQIGKIANNGDNKLFLQDARGIEQSAYSLDLSNINWWGRVILKGGANAANRTAAKIGKQFDPVTRGKYDQYLVKRAVKAWEESYKVLCNACTFSRWIGWAYFKFMFQFGNKLKELLKLSNPEEALKRGMPSEAFFAWQNILSFEDQKISISNGDTTDKLQFSYNPQDGLTANIIDSQNNETSV